jgi:mono/diheme cytochrome c family protein
VMNRSARMPAFGATLSAAEIRALVRHIRTLCRCEGPTWSRNE